jgi:hypothetical protein
VRNDSSLSNTALRLSSTTFALCFDYYRFFWHFTSPQHAVFVVSYANTAAAQYEFKSIAEFLQQGSAIRLLRAEQVSKYENNFNTAINTDIIISKI